MTTGSDITDFVWLASQSPRRLELLAQIGVGCRLLLPDAGEDAERLEALVHGETPEVYVRRVTRAKLAAAQLRLAGRQQGAGCERAAAPTPPTNRSDAGPTATAPGSAELWPSAPILCADTTVTIDGAILGKPGDAADARRMLERLSGRRHLVLTAVSIGVAGREHHALSVSEVAVAPLDAVAIAAYVATGEPFGKAGAYGIQGRFAAWVERIHGSHSGIMGLPLFETAALLRAAGVPLGPAALPGAG